MSILLDRWFLENKREFPWRENPTPYRVWVSEVMLQQTRAAVVIPYFLRWMELFPTIASLATAPLELVIKTWEGLGYYSRARNLQAGAQQIMRDFDGVVPDTKEELLQIRGLGPYTVGAILSFGFKKRAAAVDGNVLRVISRYAWIDEEIGRVSAKRRVTEEVEKLLSVEVPWVTSEALIELGATICTPAPKCSECPLGETCQGRIRGGAEMLPIKASGPKIEKIFRGVAIVEAEGHFLVKKNPEGQIMGGLSEFPYFENAKTFFSVQKELKKLGLLSKFINSMTPVKHSFTRYAATLFPFSFKLEKLEPVAGYEWIARDKIRDISFSSGHRKIAGELL